MRAAGGEVYGISSEPQSISDMAREDWELNFETVGDPHQEISRVCSERGWLTLYANQGDLEFFQRGTDWKVEHPKGYFQPGVLAVTQSKRLLYRWRSIPSVENNQGTLGRPTAEYVWKEISGVLGSKDAGDAVLDDDPVVDSTASPRFLFIAALLANGWFFRVKGLLYSPGMDMSPARMGKIMSRWFLFLAFWVLALVFLPVWPVLGAFAAWVAYVTYDFKRLTGKARGKKELRFDNV